MIPIVLTPFHQDGSLDNESIPALTRFYGQNGASALIVLGIMGEAHALSDRERELVVDQYVSAAGNKMPVVATISAPATEVAVERARRAQNLGAKALMVAPPPGVNNPRLLSDHFERIALSTDLPWILQDEPVTTGVKLTADFIVQLAETIPTLSAVKIEDVPTASKIAAIHRMRPELKLDCLEDWEVCTC
ncbi:dihydrodipicolinate synthase family protein [Sulfobacillus harzensis]|nr:dihydrodipicolinate synthase family protein [Sulfobacillus harzensis]